MYRCLSSSASHLTDTHRGDGELHRELAAIAPQRGQLDPLVQDWALAGGEEASQAGRMGLAMRLRHDDVGQELPQDLPFSPSEHGLGLLVPRRDSTDVIHRDVGVERRVEDRREPHLVKRVERVVAGRAVSTQRHVDSFRDQPRHRRLPAGDDPLDAGIITGRPGIGRDALSDALGLADIEHLAVGVDHAVDAG